MTRFDRVTIESRHGQGSTSIPVDYVTVAGDTIETPNGWFITREQIESGDISIRYSVPGAPYLGTYTAAELFPATPGEETTLSLRERATAAHQASEDAKAAKAAADAAERDALMQNHRGNCGIELIRILCAIDAGSTRDQITTASRLDPETYHTIHSAAVALEGIALIVEYVTNSHAQPLRHSEYTLRIQQPCPDCREDGPRVPIVRPYADDATITLEYIGKELAAPSMCPACQQRRRTEADEAEQAERQAERAQHDRRRAALISERDRINRALEQIDYDEHPF